MPRHAGHPSGDRAYAWAFLFLLAAAFVAYVAGVLLVRRSAPRFAVVAAIACVVQLAPLASPLLLSTDAWTYWDYGRIAAIHGGNPYDDAPSRFRDDPAFPYVGTDWRDATTVYGPAFTLASEPVAHAAGASADAAAWIFKTIAALAVVVAAFLAARLSRRPQLALAFVGWNPVLAVHLAGGGHNDAWIAVFVVAALAAAVAGYRWAAGVCWALASLVKWVPLLLLPLRALEARATRRQVGHAGFAGAVVVVGALATWRYGWTWAHAFTTLARNANRETRFALPHRVEQLGVPHAVTVALFAAAFALFYLWALRSAARGRDRLALTMVAALVATPYLAPWYLVWAVPLAAAEDDELAAGATLVLGGYLLRQTVPL